MGSSYTEFRGYGFWARDGLLEVWLEALAEVVPAQAPEWLRDAQEHWRFLARVGFVGHIDASLHAILTTPDEVAVVAELAERAYDHLARLAGATGYVPAAWMSERRTGGQDSWWRDLDLGYVRQIADAFTALLRGELRTTAATSPTLPLPTPSSPFWG